MRDARASRASGVAVVVLHAIAFVAALNLKPIRAAWVEAVPLTVALLPDTAPRAPATRAPIPMPRMAEPPRDSVPLVAIPVAPSTEPSTEASAPRVTASAAPVTQAQAAPAAMPVVAPIFNADYLDNPAPAYPSLSRRLNEEGRVLLRVRVTVDGRAESIEVARSSGFERLDRSAMQAVSRWRFVPARQGDRAVAASVLVPVSFVLKG